VRVSFEALLRSSSNPEAIQLQSLHSQLTPACPSRLGDGSGSVEVLRSLAGGSWAGDKKGDEQHGEKYGGCGGDEESLAPASQAAPVWEGGQAEQMEKEFKIACRPQSLDRLLVERERRWGEELAWLQGVARRTEAVQEELALRQRAEEKKEEAASAEEQKLVGDIQGLDDMEGHLLRLQEASDALAAAREAAESLGTSAAEARGQQGLAEAALEQERRQAQGVEEALEAARTGAALEAEASLRRRWHLEQGRSKMERRAKTHLKEWQTVKFGLRRLELLQTAVASRLREEAQGRSVLRAEAQRVLEELQELELHLDAAAVLDN